MYISLLLQQQHNTVLSIIMNIPLLAAAAAAQYSIVYYYEHTTSGCCCMLFVRDIEHISNVIIHSVSEKASQSYFVQTGHSSETITIRTCKSKDRV